MTPSGASLALVPEAQAVMRFGQSIALTPTQYRLLEVLVAAQGAIVDHATLAQCTAGPDEAKPRGRNNIQAHLSALRRRIDDPFGTSSIIAVYGRGYRLTPSG